MSPKPRKTKSNQLLLFLIVIGLCFIGLWRFFPAKKLNYGHVRNEPALLNQVSENKELANTAGDISRIRIFDQKAGYSLESAHLEVCVIDAQSGKSVESGHVNISKQFENIISGDLGQNGCTRFTLSPGRYQLSCQIPGFYGGEYGNLEIGSSVEYVRETMKVYRSAVIRGIVKNAHHQPEPGAIVICGMSPGSSSSFDLFAPLGTPVNTNNLGEFNIALPSTQKSIMIYASKPPQAIAKVGPLNANEIGNKQIEIILPEEDKTVISGRIFDIKMRPVRGATVQFYQTTLSNNTLFSNVMNIMLKRKVKSDYAGYYSLPISIPIMGIFEISAEGFELYQEQIKQDIDKSITRDIYLKTPSPFSVQVYDPAGQKISDIPIRAENANIYRMGMGSDPDQYYVTKYPVKIFADGSLQNLGISERKLIEGYQKEIILTLGNCEIQGKVTDENEYPIKHINIKVTSIGGTENDPGPRLAGVFHFVSEAGMFTLRNLIPGICIIRITGSSDRQEIFEERTLAIALDEDKITQSRIVLTKKQKVP